MEILLALLMMANPVAFDDPDVGSLPVVESEYVADPLVQSFAQEMEPRVKPVWSKAKCVLWNSLSDEPSLNDEGERITKTCWPMGTATAMWVKDGRTEWLTAAHVVDGGFSRIYLALGWKIVPSGNYYLGHRRDIEASLVRKSGKQALLRSKPLDGIEDLERANVDDIGVGQKVFTLGTPRIGESNISLFVNRGYVRGVNKSNPRSDVVVDLGAIPGESGSLAFVSDGEDFYYFGTLETGYRSSDKSGIAYISQDLWNASREGDWDNWSELTERQKRLWRQVSESDYWLGSAQATGERVAFSIETMDQEVGRLVIRRESGYWDLYGRVSEADVSGFELLEIQLSDER